MDAIMVVSEIGEIWSPHIAPEKIAPKDGIKIAIFSGVVGMPNCASPMIIGTDIGIRSIIVPHDVPVAIPHVADVIKSISGINFMLNEPSSMFAK